MCQGAHDYIPATNVAKLEMIYDQDGQEVVNVFHFLSDQGWDAQRLGLLCGLMADWYDGSIKPNYPNEYSLRIIKATDLTSQSAPTSESDFVPPNFGGDLTANQLPNNVTVVIKWITAKRGRSYRGRTYYPCLTETMAVGNRLTVEGVAAVGGAAGALFTAATDAQWWPVVVSYCANKTWRTTAEVTRITAYSLNEVLDSQRRRLPERGR